MAALPTEKDPAALVSGGWNRIWMALVAWVAPAATLPMEHRLFQLMCRVGMLLSVGLLLSSACFAPRSGPKNALLVLLGLGSLLMLQEARAGRYWTRTSVVLTMLLIDASWALEGGSHGTLALWFFAVPVLLTLYLHGSGRWAMLGLFLANGLVLFALEAYSVPWRMLCLDSHARWIDLALGFVASSLTCTGMIWIVKSSYDRERKHLAEANRALEHSLKEIQTLRGLLPICSWCKQIRNEAGLWQQMEQYLAEHTDASFTHGICPRCAREARAALDLPSPTPKKESR